MVKIFKTMVMCSSVVLMGSCVESKEKQTEFDWVVDRFDNAKILRYQVPGYEELPLNEKLLIYYLSEAALYGRDILFDQNFKYNLAVRRTLEAVYQNYEGDKNSSEWRSFEEYVKKVWFSNGVHDHDSNDKFVPKFSSEYFDILIAGTPSDKLPQDFGTNKELVACVKSVVLDPSIYAKKSNQTEGEDVITTSANNYYSGVTQSEVEKFYADMAVESDPCPISYGLNSQLVKVDGEIVERVWKVDGMYSEAIEKVVYWLEKAKTVANESQKALIEKLISYYKSGDLRTFDEFNTLWVKDTASTVDFINGFTETYGDPMGYKASWESLVNFKNVEATKRTQVISDNAQWFEDRSPVDDKFKKEKVKGVSAKVITVAMLGGDCYPTTPIGVNLPNADWIRRDYGSKSVTIENITSAYAEAGKGSGFVEEFFLREDDRKCLAEFGTLADNLHVDLHECLGHGSGQLAPGTKGDELKQYGATLEEARADLFALYYLADEKLIELGIVPSEQTYKAEYSKYIMNGIMTQLTRVQLGKDVEQAHMRNRKLVAEWCYENGAKDSIIVKVVENNKTYFVVNDFEKLRVLFGDLLKEIQRIKSEGDFNAGKELVERYAISVDRDLHKEVLDRYNALNLEPYNGFVNPVYTPVVENGEIVDVKIDYSQNYVDQMLEYSNKYSVLPTKN